MKPEVNIDFAGRPNPTTITGYSYQRLANRSGVLMSDKDIAFLDTTNDGSVFCVYSKGAQPQDEVRPRS